MICDLYCINEEFLLAVKDSYTKEEQNSNDDGAVTERSP